MPQLPKKTVSNPPQTTKAPVISHGAYQVEPRSGNSALDYALAQSLGMLARMFDVLPGFAYYRDDDGPNAKATPQPMLDRSDGTVLFGLNFMRMLLARPERPDAAMLAVTAHEFGHIVSYKNGMIRTLDPRGDRPFPAEQYADYIAGFFAGKRKLEQPNFPAAVFASTQHSFGGNSRGSHGTRAERGAAVQQGFLDAYSRKLTPDQGKQAALQYAMSRG